MEIVHPMGRCHLNWAKIAELYYSVWKLSWRTWYVSRKYFDRFQRSCILFYFRFGEELCAWIKFHPDQDTTATDLVMEDIKSFLKKQLAHFKIPKYMMAVNEFPTTVTGKVQKFKMREESIEKLKLQKWNFIKDYTIPLWYFILILKTSGHK